MSKYPLGSGVCADHPCDRCDECLSGICCGREVADANLPSEGSWDGPTHVPVGHIVDTDDGMTCHICGDAFHALWAHIGVHDVTGEEYRSYFGLAVTQPLASELCRLRRRANRPSNAAGYAALQEFQAGLTGEQRSLLSWQRVQRAQVRRQLASISPTGVAASRASRSRPEVKKAWTAKLRARRPRADSRSTGVVCPECGALFCPLNVQRTLCGQEECLRSARSRAGRLGRQRQLAGAT